MDTFKDRLKQLRNEKNLTQEELAKYIGTTRATLASWETGRREPDMETLRKLSDYFNVTLDWLMGNTDVRKSSKNEVHPAEMVILPILGDIRAGRPLFAEEHFQGKMPFPKQMLTEGFQHFLLNVHGDSMTGDDIQPGDIVLIRVQNYIDYEGQIAAVIVNGDEACLKHVYHPENSNMVILRSSNPAYADIVHPANDIIINGVYAGMFKAPKVR